MKLYNLSASDSCPCIVMKFKTCTIMFDCSLDLSSLFNFLPLSLVDKRDSNLLPWKLKDEHGRLVTNEELKDCSGKVFVDSAPEFCYPETELIDLASVDVILISNSGSMAALPYITEYHGFNGMIYATEPALQIGRLHMEELVEYCYTVSKGCQATKWKNRKLRKQLPTSLADCWDHNLQAWKQCFSADDLQASLSRVSVVRYDEKVNIFGALNVTAYSSGYSLGSCNWLVESEFEKITYFSGSSSLVTHPQPLDSQFLHNSDLLIFTGLTQAPTHNPDNMLAEFCACISKTVKNGGNVLIPCLPSGLLYDLLECLLPYMEQANMINIPIYLVSPSAKASLALSQIYSEWLHPNKQNKAYLPEPPFPHDELLQLGRLKVFSSVHDGLSAGFKKPCITFAGHPSLRLGDAVHFINMWKNSALNSVIFVGVPRQVFLCRLKEPNFSYLDALAPFQPITARVFHYPIDTRTNHQAAGRMIDSLKPRLVAMPTGYTKPPILTPNRTDLVLSTENPTIELQPASVHNLKIKRTLEKVDLEPEEGFPDVKIEEGSSGKIILLPDTVIQIEDGSTHIVCEGTDTLRVKLRDIMLKNLSGI